MVLFMIMLTMFLTRPWQKTMADHYVLILCLLLCLIPIAFYQRISRFQFTYVVGLGSLVYIFSMYLRIKNFENMPLGSLFLKGYNFGLIHMVTQLALSHFPHIVSLELIFFLGRVIINQDLAFGDIIHQVFTSTYLIILRYVLEKADRRQFYNFYESKENVDKFKNIMAYYLTSGIIALDKSLKTSYFVNEKFKSYVQEQTEFSFENTISFLNSIIYDQQKNPILQHPTIAKKSAPTIQDLLEDSATLFAPNQKSSSLTFFCYYMDKNNTKRSFEASIFPFLWDDNESLIVLLNDVTAQESLISLKLANDTKEQVITTVSHELRTPVSGLLGMLQIMASKFASANDEMKNYLQICKANANLLLTFLNSILDLQQIKASRLKLNIEKVEIRKLLEEIVMLFEFQCSQRGVSIKLEIPEDLPQSISTDRARLMQVIINLISNAFKFTRKGQITINIQRTENDFVLVTVSDTGVGIKDEDKTKLFNSFQKLECNSEMNPQGAGLGLTISNSLVKLLNKSQEGIKFESEWTKGTKFWFEIPLSSNEGKSIADDDLCSFDFLDIDENVDIACKIRPSLVPSLQRRKCNEHEEKSILQTTRCSDIEELISPKDKYILLVDDNPFNLLIAQQLLERLNFKVKCAYNGIEAIEVIEQIKSQRMFISFVFMDIMMPFMNGYEATKKIRQMMKQEYIPIIALSAGNDEMDKKLSLEAGMDEYMCKPLNERDLLKVFNKYKITQT